MRINNIGYNHSHDADFCITRPDGSGDNLLVLLKTPAIFVINGKNVISSKDSFILFREGTPQYYHAKGSLFSNDWFHFTIEENEHSLFEALGIPFNTVTKIGDISDLSLIIKNMCYENYSSNLYRVDSMELYLKLFFVKLGEKIKSPNKSLISTHYEKLSIVRSKIYSMPQFDWNVEGLSHELTMSKSHFEHMYKKIFGTSVINEVINSRIEHAKFMLTTTDISVNRIAEMCGYKSDVHFMRQFKSRVNMTPSQFRKLRQGKILDKS